MRMAGFPHPFVTPHLGYPGYAHPNFVPNPVTSVSQLSAVQINAGWVEHHSHDGRKYYFNTYTHQTTWEKPQELKTQREKILFNSPWKEFKSENGKPYYYNEITKQSVWVKPQELIDAENQAAACTPTSNNSIPEPPNGIPPVTPCTPATPKEDISKPPEPSEIERAMKATLASFEASDAATASIPIPLPPDKLDDSEEESDEEKPVNNSQSATTVPPATQAVPEYKTRAEMAEGLRRLFRDCNVPGASTWEQALKLISGDPRYAVLKTFNEKKQIFNVYKTQRLKEEREEQRIRIKRAKEDLEKYLLKCNKLHSTMSYRRVDQLLSDTKEWTDVPDRDRREIFEDVMQEIGKREREEAKILRKRNIRVFNEILSEMLDLTYRTTWSEAQQMLLDNTRFTEDVELQNLDKEDALICFEEHICMLEQEYEEEKDRERRKQKREQRKNREAFIVLLEELHERKLLTSISLWKDLYQIINKDDRFHKMLAQRGSTPLDLFKFYVESLKARFPAEKKIIKEILKYSSTPFDTSVTFDDFCSIITADERSKGIDDGNLRLAYDSLLEKAQNRERERQRDDARRMRKLEQNFCEMLSSSNFIQPTTSWEEVREKLGDHPAFKGLSLESERIRLFKEHIMSIDNSFNEDNHRSRKDKHRHDESASANQNNDKEVDQKRKKETVSPSPAPSNDSRAQKSDDGSGDKRASQKHRKHRKSKKSKHRKSKHHSKHRKGTDNKRPDDELEEGEAADDDDDDDDNDEDGGGDSANPEAVAAAGGGGDANKRQRRHRHGGGGGGRRQSRTSDPEDGEELDSTSDGEVYDHDSKRKRR
ncbi:unnamed protein product [Trichobilharzia szidati]|nr:unnamed protein product [Trichobilharzia szidati]